MRRSDKRQKFSIRKFNVGVASALIGATLIGLGLPNQLAKADVTVPVKAKTVNARYVLTSELTAEESRLIQTQLPSQTVDCTDDYYLVYRPVTTLPATNSGRELLGFVLGGSLLVLGISFGKNRKNRLISSAFLLTATGVVGVSGVSAIQSQALSAYNQTLTLQVGDQLPDFRLDIANHEFVGYILVGDCDLADVVAEPTAEQPAVTVQETTTGSQAGGAAALAPEEAEPSTPETTPAQSTPTETLPVQSETAVVSEEATPVTSEVVVEDSKETVSEVLVEETKEVVSEVIVEKTETSLSEVVTEVVTSEISETVVEVVTSEVSQVIDEKTSEVSEVVVEVITSEISETVIEVITSEVSQVEVEVVTSEVSEVVVEETSTSVSQVVVEQSEEVQSTSQVVVEESQAPVSQSETPISTSEVAQESSQTASEEASEVISESASQEQSTSEEISEEISQSEVTSEETSQEVSEEQSASEVLSEDSQASLEESQSEISETSQADSREQSEETSQDASTSEQETKEDLPSETEEVVDKQPLDNLYQASQDLVKEDYSTETWNKLQIELTKAQAVLSDDTVTQETVDLAKVELDKAIAALAVEKSVLKNLLETTKDKVSTDYSPESWHELLKALDNAQAIFDDSQSKQSAVNAQVVALRAALGKLGVDKSELVKLLNQVSELTSTDFSSSTWSVLSDAKATSDAVNADSKAVQSTVDKTVSDLQKAVAQLGVDKSELVKLLNQVSGFTSTDYSAPTWSVLADAKATSDTVNEDNQSVQSTVDKTVSDLQKAIAQLGVDKSELVKLLNQVSELTSTEYSASTWSVLSDAKATSDIVNEDSQAVQSTVDKTVSDLQAAINQLGVDKSELVKLLNQVSGFTSTDYSASTWSVLADAKATSDAVNADSKAVQSTVDKTVSDLQKAIAQLGVDKSELVKLLNQVSELTSTDYSAPTWSVLSEAKATSDTVNADSKAVQSTVDKTVSDLQAAIDQLGVDTTALEKLLTQAAALTESLYRPATWSVLADEVMDSTALLSSETLKQSAINQATEDLQAAIDQLLLRLVPPTLVYDTIETDAMDKSLTVTYHLEDKDETLTGVTFALYDDEGQKVHEETVDVTKELTVTLPYYDTDYTLKTTYTYDLQEGDGDTKAVIKDEIVSIELKKIEIKDIDSLTLYRFDDETSSYNRVSTLAALPEQTGDYFVLIQSDTYKDILLPVSSIQETTTTTGATAYKVEVALDELVQDLDDSAVSDYVENFSFTIGQTPEAKDNVITSFGQLVTAIESNPAGTYYLGANLYADDMDLPADQATYITTRFTGELIGEYEGQQYSIYNLSAPLFNNLYTASISKLDLKSVKISTTDSNAAALALQANGSQFKDISVSGQVIAKNKAAGLVIEVAQSLFDDVSFEGKLVATARDESISVGGIAADTANTVIRKAAADVTISTYSDSRLESVTGRVGGIAGYVYNNDTLASIQDLFGANYNVENAVVTGQITHYGQGANVGGIVGSTTARIGQSQGLLNNVLSAVDVDGGHQVTGLTRTSDSVSQAYVLTGKEGQAQAYEVTSLSASEAEAVNKALGITTNLDDSLIENILTTDYTSLKKASADRETAYKNIALIMPFYNKEQVVKYGNLVATSDKIYTTEILSVTPMVGDGVVADLAKNKEVIDQIMIHYADGTVEYRQVAYTGDFKNTAISEYSIVGTDLIYTPEALLSTYDSIINAVAPILKQLEYSSLSTAEVLNAFTDDEIEMYIVASKTNKTINDLIKIRNNDKNEYGKLVQKVMPTVSDAEAEALTKEYKEDTYQEKMSRLYLDAAFSYIQDDVETFLRQILSTSNAVNTTGGVVDKVLIDYITDNKEKLLLSLSYVIRWYDINFGETNIENLVAYYQDFFGQQVNTLEWLVSIADFGYDNLRLANNLTTYAQSIAPNNAYGHLLDYLTAHRELFTDYETDNDWFKDTTTAYIQEVASEVYSDEDVSVYSKLSYPEQANGILPLLTASEGTYLISTITTITYGMFATYMDMDLAETDPAAYQEALAYVQSLVDRAAAAQGKHLDSMTQIFDDFGEMKRVLPVWDAYLNHETDAFIDLYGAEATQAMLDFFGPIERAETEFEDGTGAYALTNNNMLSKRGESINFVKTRLLEDYGLSVYTHELVHIMDRMVYLYGEGRRSGQDPESYATGLLESPTYPNEAIFGFNTIHDWTDLDETEDRFTNVSPDRFQSADDLQAYASGVLDVIYLLDVAEANAVLASSNSTKSNWYRKLYNTRATSQVVESLRTLTSTELNSIQTWEDLVNLGVVDRRTPENLSNSYYKVPLFSSNYAALMNDQGTTAGQLTFRRLAYEILAAAGKDGFVAYTSDQEMGEDSFILDKLNDILRTSYSSYAEFKIDQIQQRLDKAGQLSAVEISYLGETITISSYDQLQELMAAAVAYDSQDSRRLTATNNTSRVYELKSAIYQAYLRQTNDFTTSIFN